MFRDNVEFPEHLSDVHNNLVAKLSFIKCASHMYTCNICPGDVLTIQVTPRLGMGQDSHTCELSNKLKKIFLDQG